MTMQLIPVRRISSNVTGPVGLGRGKIGQTSLEQLCLPDELQVQAESGTREAEIQQTTRKGLKGCVGHQDRLVGCKCYLVITA